MAVTKNQAKLLQKLADFVAECEQLYDLRIVYGNTIKIKHVKRLRKKLYCFGSWAYMMSPRNEYLAFLRGMLQIDESGKLLTVDNLDNYYLCPVYTLDELLAMAEADVVKYTQNEITE